MEAKKKVEAASEAACSELDDEAWELAKEVMAADAEILKMANAD